MQREFTVACGEEESCAVVEAAAHLDRKMRAVSKGAQVLSMERCAVMAGLNISHELLALRQSLHDNEQINSRLQRLQRRVDQAVAGLRRPAS